MIIDLTSFVKTELNNHPQPTNNSLTKMSHTIRCYAMYTEDTYNSLIKIRNILNESRDNYFSNASYSFEAFSDRQRHQLNELVKKGLDDVSNQINELNEGLKKQVALKSKTERQYLKAVILCLFQFYKKVEGMFREFQVFTLKRMKKIQDTIAFDKQAEKAKYKTPQIQKKSISNADQALEKQAGILYVQKVKEQSELKETKKQIESINELMANMSNIVLEQELQTSGFLQIGETGLFHIQRGNKNLVEANILAKQTGRIYSLIFYLMGFVLLLFDFLKS